MARRNPIRGWCEWALSLSRKPRSRRLRMRTLVATTVMSFPFSCDHKTNKRRMFPHAAFYYLFFSVCTLVNLCLLFFFLSSSEVFTKQSTSSPSQYQIILCRARSIQRPPSVPSCTFTRANTTGSGQEWGSTFVQQLGQKRGV